MFCHKKIDPKKEFLYLVHFKKWGKKHLDNYFHIKCFQENIKQNCIDILNAEAQKLMQQTGIMLSKMMEGQNEAEELGR